MSDSAVLRQELESILQRPTHEAVDSVMEAYRRQVGSKDGSLVLFGAGRLGKLVLAGLRARNIEPLAFADNNPELWHTAVDGLLVLPPEEAAERFRYSAAFVTTVYTSAPVRHHLLDMRIDPVSFPMLAWRHAEAFLPHGALSLPGPIYEHAKEVRLAFDVWGDDASRWEYVAQLGWRTSLRPGLLPEHSPAQETYFPDDLVRPLDRETYVDCGAFDGDSIRAFLFRRGNRFREIVAVEPDPANFHALESFRAALPPAVGDKITLVRKAVGQRRETVLFEATASAASAVGPGQVEVPCAPLDEIVAGRLPTYVKMDIEGSEEAALVGTSGTISRCAPVLAICLYHRPQDLWRIPLLIKSLSDQYSLYLRRYSDECWELVCYAVPLDRVPA